MGVQFILFMGIEVGVGVLLARRLRPVEAAARGAALARPAPRQPHRQRRDDRAVLLAIIYAAAIGVFHVRIDGSVAGFVGIAIAFALLTVDFGLLIAAIGKTPEATRGLAIFATLVMVMLGGAWVPSFVFPPWLQTASLVVPTRWAVDGLDAMTWRGLGFDAAIAPIAVLLAFSALFAAIASGASTGRSRAAEARRRSRAARAGHAATIATSERLPVGSRRLRRRDAIRDRRNRLQVTEDRVEVGVGEVLVGRDRHRWQYGAADAEVAAGAHRLGELARRSSDRGRCRRWA